MFPKVTSWCISCYEIGKLGFLRPNLMDKTEKGNSEESYRFCVIGFDLELKVVVVTVYSYIDDAVNKRLRSNMAPAWER